MTEAPAGYASPRPLWDDEIGATIAARAEAAGASPADGAAGGPEAGLRILRVTVTGRAERRRLRGSCLAVTALTPHPGILTVHEVGFTSDDHPFLVTDLPQGNLDGRLAGAGPLAVPEAVAAGQALAATLAAAHGNGVLHADVRPGNVVWDGGHPGPGTAPLLADFGVTQAALAAGAADLSPLAMVHAAREVFGWETPGPPADVYGLASTIYTMLSGRAPYHAEALLGRAALYQRVLRGVPSPVPAAGVPARLSALLADMMAPDPASRPALPDVASALAELAASAPAGSSPASRASPVAAALAPPATHGSATPGSAMAAPARTAAGPDAPGTRPPAGERGRPRYGVLALLAGIGVIALLAGIVWGVVTSRGPAPRPSPAAGATTGTGGTTAATLSPAQQAIYRPRQVSVQPVSKGARVSWSPPAVVAGVSEYLVIAEIGGQPAQARTAAVTSGSAVFTGLRAGQRYCFVVGALLQAVSGQPVTAPAAPVCAVIGLATGVPA